MAKSTEVKVGLVFFLGLGLLIIVTIMVRQGELGLNKKGYLIDVLFSSVGGLRKNDAVELAGMEIGKVEHLEIREGKIKVHLRIDEGIKIKKDSKIIIIEKSLLGGMVVSISMGSPEAETVSPGSILTGEKLTGMTEFIAKASIIGEKAENTLGEIDEITKKIAAGEGTIGKLINEDNIAEKAEKTLDELGKAIPKLTSTFERVDRITEKIEKGEGTIGKLVAEEELYENVSETLESAKTVAEKVGEFTERIEKVRTYIGVDSAYNEDSANTLTKIYLRIEPRPHKLYLAGASVLTGSGTEWDEKDEADLELDLQLGRRFFDDKKLTGRVGLFESRVGAGIDYAFNNRFSLSVEGRDTWTREKNEDIDHFLLRSRLQCKIYRGLSFHIGADNILDETAFNFGLRLEFIDEDIKYILGALSAGT